MQKKRLLKLAAGLRSLTKAEQKHFDMAIVCTIPKECDVPKHLPKDAKKINCGAAACAIGWTPTFFPRANFRLKKDNYYYSSVDVVYTDKEGEHENFAAARRFYGINDLDSQFLFDPCEYPNGTSANLTAKKVAARIEQFVKTDGKNCARHFIDSYGKEWYQDEINHSELAVAQ